MKLGTETGSFINHMHSRGVIGQPTAVVGMGATELLWSDRHALTIVEVVLEKGEIKRIATTQDESKVVAGSTHDGSADYEYVTRLEANRTWWRIGRKGLWESIAMNDAGRWVKAGSHGLRIGEREEYRDPSL